MRKFFQFLFRKPVTWLAQRFSSAPRPAAVHKRLSRLLKEIENGKIKKGKIFRVSAAAARLVIMSDLHKGAGDDADVFNAARKNYRDAVQHYHKGGFTYIALGDVEELWQNNIDAVFKHNTDTFQAEKEFVKDGRYIKVFGNHDLFWVSTILSNKKWLEKMYGRKLPVYEGVIFELGGLAHPLRLMLTHGHQGDAQSDGNKFSQWFVANIWRPVQAYLEVNINTPSNDFQLRDKHNIIIYEWTLNYRHTMLVTGHTHKPVFASLNHLEKLKLELEAAREENNAEKTARLVAEISRRQQEYKTEAAFAMRKPSYFNSGCCCFADGDLTAIEIENGYIRLVKWEGNTGSAAIRKVLDEAPLAQMAEKLKE